MRILCEVVFAAFSFCWIHFFQGDLICSAYQRVFEGSDSLLEMAHHHIALSVVLTLIAMLFCLLGRLLFRFKSGLYGCNYILAAAFLGIITGFDGDYLLGQSTAEWFTALAFLIVLPVCCKIIESVPKSSYNNVQRAVAGNLFILSLLFIMVGCLGNTDENLHRKLRMEHYLSQGEYDELLQVGKFEEESSKEIDLLRVQAMLNLESGNNPADSKIGDLLFGYSIADPVSLSIALKKMESIEAYLASCLLDGDMGSFTDSIDIGRYVEMPKYYMQAMVMEGDSLIQSKYPEQFSGEKALYDEFLNDLESLSGQSQQFKANSTFIKYHNTYYWFHCFCIRRS